MYAGDTIYIVSDQTGFTLFPTFFFLLHLLFDSDDVSYDF